MAPLRQSCRGPRPPNLLTFLETCFDPIWRGPCTARRRALDAKMTATLGVWSQHVMAGFDDKGIGLSVPEFLDGFVWRPELQRFELLGEVAGDQPVADVPSQFLD